MESVYFFILHATGFRVEPAVDDGDDHQGQEGAGEEAPDDGNGHGLLDFRPSPHPRARGTSPKTVVVAVIRMGRRWVIPASTMASREGIPLALS